MYRAAGGGWLAVDTNLSTTYSVSADDPSVGIATVTIPLSDFGGASVGPFNFEFQVKRVVSSNAITTTLDYMPNPGSFGTTAPVPDPSKSAMEKYKADFKKEMKAFDKKIAKLGKKVKEQGSNAGTEAKESWNDLEAKQANAKSKLKSLSKEAWDKTKTEADVAREDLRKAYDKSVSYFK